MVTTVEMTHEEKVKMYKKLKKKHLISMLIEANKQLANRQPTLEFQPYFSFGERNQYVPNTTLDIFKVTCNGTEYSKNHNICGHTTTNQ